MGIFEELGRGVDVFVHHVLYDGLRDLFSLEPSWKTQFIGILFLLGFFSIVFLISSFSGAETAQKLAKCTVWLIVTMIIMYPFLYWVDKSGFWSGFTFFVYFIYTYGVLGGGKGSKSILANLIATTVLMGLILWYYTWQMVIYWFKSIGLWLFVFNLILARGMKGGIEGETSNWKVMVIGMFIVIYFICVIYLGWEVVDRDVGCREWEGVKPFWK